jgi:hypothetical protein
MGLGIPLSFDRLNKIPLDSSSVFSTELALNNYLSAGVPYPGQICSVIENNNVYLIKSDNTLKLIGSGVGGGSSDYYPLNSNPSGYITSSQTGDFYPASNPSEFVTDAEVDQKIVDAFNLGSLTSIVYTTGDQDISGNKDFLGNLMLSGERVVTSSNVNRILMVSESSFDPASADPATVYILI